MCSTSRCTKKHVLVHNRHLQPHRAPLASAAFRRTSADLSSTSRDATSTAGWDMQARMDVGRWVRVWIPRRIDFAREEPPNRVDKIDIHSVDCKHALLQAQSHFRARLPAPRAPATHIRAHTSAARPATWARTAAPHARAPDRPCPGSPATPGLCRR